MKKKNYGTVLQRDPQYLKKWDMSDSQRCPFYNYLINNVVFLLEK